MMMDLYADFSGFVASWILPVLIFAASSSGCRLNPLFIAFVLCLYVFVVVCSILSNGTTRLLLILSLLLLLQSSKDITTLEALGKYFRCTGSSMEVLAEEWSRREDGGLLGIGCWISLQVFLLLVKSRLLAYLSNFSIPTINLRVHDSSYCYAIILNASDLENSCTNDSLIGDCVLWGVVVPEVVLNQRLIQPQASQWSNS